jgi:uncharacterized protein
VGGLRKDIQMIDSDTLASRGFVVAPGLIGPAECRALANLWPEKPRFRSHVIMQRHGYGQGEYQYFAYPLPDRIEALRQALYPELAAVANRWNEQLGIAKRFPPTLQAWLRQCHAGGQKRPTPLLLRYGPGDYNCLHRDLYGELVFPLQVVINLSKPGVDHTGGEFLLYEQRPRAQSRGTATLIPHGHGLVFTTRERPVPSARGWSIGPVRHGVSMIRSGQRFTLGLVFHDAA